MSKYFLLFNFDRKGLGQFLLELIQISAISCNLCNCWAERDAKMEDESKLFQLLQIEICAIILIPHFPEIIDHRASLIFNLAATCLRLPFLGTAESWKHVQ